MPDSEIDTSDIPEIRELPSDAVVGRFYRPKKTTVTMRLDADVVAWLKASGEGYQTRINAYLRELMYRLRPPRRVNEAAEAGRARQPRAGMTVRNARIARFEPAPPEGNQGTVSVPWFPVFFLKPGAFLVEGVTRFPTVRLSTASVLFQLLPKFLMDYCAGWGNRRNRDGTAPPVINVHLWGRKTVPDTVPPPPISYR